MEELVAKAKRNDEKAFDELIGLVKKELYLIAKAKVKYEDDVADAIQETIFICYRNIHKLRDNKFFKTWLVRILINECNKILKKKKNNISYEENEMENYLKSSEDSLENIGFDILIDGLKEEEKIILTLYYYFEYSSKEISKILKINESTVRSKISRAKEKIKNKYKGGYYG